MRSGVLLRGWARGWGIVWVLGFCLAGGVGVSGQERPSFVVILADDLGYGDLGCYGHPHIRTPNLDRMAEEGMRLAACYSAAPVCSPARVGLLTGKNPNRLGVYDWIPAVGQGGARAAGDHRGLVHLREGVVTLPGLLAGAGYGTAVAGKWHCNADFGTGGQPGPGEAGFGHWFATQNNAAPSHRDPVNFLRNGAAVGKLEGYSCRLVVAEALDWLRGWRGGGEGEAGGDRPFFLLVAFHEPHEPVASPPEMARGYLERGATEEGLEADYFANVENLDAAVGELLAGLDELGVGDETLVFFTSDNGPETLRRYRGAERSYGVAGDLRGMKLWTTEAGVRVPGIVRWPGVIEGGQVVDEVVSSLDLLPTFCGMAGLWKPGGEAWDGQDILPILAGGTIDRQKPLLWVYYNAINEQRVAMRDGRWKVLARLEDAEGKALGVSSNLHPGNIGAIRAASLAGFELYDLEEDMAEAVDLAGERTELMAELRAKLEAAYRELVEHSHVWGREP